MRLNDVYSDMPEKSSGIHFKIEDVISAQGIYVCTTSGVSMYPMLRDRTDTAVISPCAGRLKKYDVPLYRRGDSYVLHRIIKVLPDSYIIRGDNCVYSERGITDKDIIGVLTGFYRGNKNINMNGIGYRTYIRLCRLSYPFRFIYYILKRAVFLLKKNKKDFRRE